jgi:hypothetical protein
MKVPMPPFLIAAKDNAGNLSIGEFMEVFVDRSKLYVPETEFTPQV